MYTFLETFIFKFVCHPAFNGCPFEVDDVWGITWPNTERNSSNTQLCPGGYDALGMYVQEICINKKNPYNY